MRPLAMEDNSIFQLNKHKACMCAHAMAVVPSRQKHIHSSNGVLFLVDSKSVWITCLKEECTLSLNKNWKTYMQRARYVFQCKCITQTLILLMMCDDLHTTQNLQYVMSKSVKV